MLNKIANRWKTHQQQHTARPAYLLIADIIADGINSGEFQPRDRLPPLRDLAALLAINYTTATRGYAEARRRGLIDSRPGMGSFIRGKVPSVPLNGGSSYEMTMNSPIEPGEELAQAIAAGALTYLPRKIFWPCCATRILAASRMIKRWRKCGWRSNCRRSASTRFWSRRGSTARWWGC
ncbi:GntR family transcriptional regulator [Klebsiella pneumoniae]|nr:GntR family transcriptional regulator [Klebsiella pneumoniae]